jgi:hypothetical protein
VPLIIVVSKPLEIVPDSAVEVAVARDSTFPVPLSVLSRAILKVLADFKDHVRELDGVVDAESDDCVV